jgi:hypothetical protein
MARLEYSLRAFALSVGDQTCSVLFYRSVEEVVRFRDASEAMASGLLVLYAEAEVATIYAHKVAGRVLQAYQRVDGKGVALVW